MRLNNEPAFLPVPGRKADSAAPDAAATDQRTTDTCRKFEGFLLGEMLKTMRGADSERQGVLPVSRAERIFIGQQCEALGDLLGRAEPLGMRRLLTGATGEAPSPDHAAATVAVPERGLP